MGSNVLDAAVAGATQGVKLAVNVAAMLLVFIALIAMLNWMIHHWVGSLGGLNERIAADSGGRYPGLSLQYLLGILLWPVAWILGVPGGDLMTVGQLLGEKTILNEFYAYVTFGRLKEAGVITHPKTIIITTYALCGFANFASVGIQIGGISAIAPGQRHNLAALGIRSLIGGTIACFLTACIAGMLV
jgi:CNT family concentrative nucleoside transporter